jgi:tRNA-splicing ligase RtcB (3'-phosphate/5'-hydroxy nucleic acid ligase)
MVKHSDFKRVNDYVWEVPRTFRPDMRVPARFYADDSLLSGALDDQSLEQLVNTATLPGIVGYALAMPDIHQGYGFPIGGVIATELPDGIISPGGVGYDINCGVRLLGTHLDVDEVEPYLDDLASALQRNCPTGVGRGGEIRLSEAALDQVLEQGARWALKNGYATEADLERTEESGRIPGADVRKVSARARERGRDQLGTLGAGNHFIEVDVVDEVFDEEAADRMGLSPGRVVAQIHCGSRGFGHQVCSDYVKRFHQSVRQYGIQLPDRELVCAPLSSPEGQDYLAAMRAAANFAFCNRQVLTHLIRRSFEQVLAGQGCRRHEHFPGLRHRPQHGQDRRLTEVDGRPVRGLRAPQRGDARVRAWLAWPAGRLPRHRAARPRAGIDGHRQLGAGRHRAAR